MVYKQRRFLAAEQQTQLISNLPQQTNLGFFLFLPLLVRRRLYSRLLVVGSGTSLLLLGSFISGYLSCRYLTKRAQLVFRHTSILCYTNLQISNQFIMVRQTLALFITGQLGLSVWVLRIRHAVRFVFSSILWSLRTVGILRTRFFIFFLWTLSWHFRYFRTPSQPLLLINSFSTFRFKCSKNTNDGPLNALSIVMLGSYRLPKYQTNKLLRFIMSCSLSSAAENQTIRSLTDFLIFASPSYPRTRQQHYTLCSSRAVVLFFSNHFLSHNCVAAVTASSIFYDFFIDSVSCWLLYVVLS